MATFEEEIKRLQPVIGGLSAFALLGKKIVVQEKENFIKKGPNIIIGNHIGSFKDIGTLFKIVPRPIFFTANKMIFNKEEFNFLIGKHLRRHLKKVGPFVQLLINPVMSYLVNFVSTNISKVGTIPVDLYEGKRLAIKVCQDYLKKGRAIIALQGRGRVMKESLHPYVTAFKKGAPVISYSLFKDEGINVPVTPLAIFGTHYPFLVPVKIRVNVGEPMFITDYLREGWSDPIEKFREALEKRVKSLFGQLVRS
jgi:1-acyl-sn-glycerol-3-phosphate acyltransferase